jgi:hypothetical protein
MQGREVRSRPCMLIALAILSAQHSGSFTTLRRAIQVDIRKGLVASAAALLYASPRDLA